MTGRGGWAQRLAGVAAAMLARAAWHLRVRRRVVLANLTLAFPERSEAERRALARRVYRNAARMALDFLLGGARAADDALVLEGEAALAAARARGPGFIACTAHLGHFDRLAALHARRGLGVTVVTRRMRPALLDRAWRCARAATGVEDVVAARGGTLRAARRALAAGRAVGCVIDQNDPRPSAVFPTFLGAPAATSPWPALLALRTGAPVLFVVTVPLPDGRHRVVYEGPLAVPRTGDPRRDALAFMQDLNDRLERWVRAHPEHWWWFHRRWKTRPAGGAQGPALRRWGRGITRSAHP